MNLLKLALASLLAIGTLAGCDGVDRAFDCNQICNRYKDCVDSNYDASACANRCEERAGDNEDYDKRADACETCLDDRSCNESIACIGDCIGIVP